MPHILFVCTANICRSPVAEFVLRDRLVKRGFVDWTVSSAGTWAMETRAASRYSIRVVKEQNIDLKPHVSQMITNDSLKAADVIICMETGHAEALRAEFPRYSDKVFLLSEMVGKRFSISDPYGGSLEGYQSMVKEVTHLVDEGFDRIIELAQ